MKQNLHMTCGKVTNSMELKKRGERGLGKVRRRKFRKGYMQLRMCDKQLFVMELMEGLGMDWANAVRVCRIGLAATHQKAGASAFVEELFNRFNIKEVWDE